MWSQAQYNKVHGLIIDPYQRVGVLCTTIQDMWSISITRALIMDPPERVLESSMKSLIDIKNKYFTIQDLWDVTLDEFNYSLHIIELKEGFKLSIPNRIKLIFLSIDQVSEEILDNTRKYTEDTLRILSHISNYIDKTGIGTYAFRRLV
jgi:hypothetical protein